MQVTRLKNIIKQLQSGQPLTAVVDDAPERISNSGGNFDDGQNYGLENLYEDGGNGSTGAVAGGSAA